MFDIEVTSLWIASQVFACAGLICIVYAYQVKDKVKTLVGIGIASLFGVVSFALLGNWVVVMLVFFAAIRCFVFAHIEKRNESGNPMNRRTSFFIMLGFMLLTIIAVAIVREWWFDWILLLASCFLIYGNWAEGIHMIRISGLVYAFLAIINHVIVGNLVAIIIEVFAAVSIILFYVKNKN